MDPHQQNDLWKPADATKFIAVEETISGPVKFFHALSTFTSRPELLIPHFRSTDLDWNSLKSDLKTCYSNKKCETLFDFLYSPIYHEGKCITSCSVGELSGSLSEETIRSLIQPDSAIKCVKIKRTIHHKPIKDSTFGWSFTVEENWDFHNYVMQIESDDVTGPYIPFKTFKAIYRMEENRACLTIPVPATEIYNTEVIKSLEVYKTVVFPKLLEWMSDSYEVKPPTLTRLRSRPLTYVANKDYWAFYDSLKSGPAEVVKQIWQESTDPVKFIHEDIGIAAYIGSFIYADRSSAYRQLTDIDNVEILDLGCGNGLLCFFLSYILAAKSKQFSVVGYDIRGRKIWPSLLHQWTMDNNKIISNEKSTASLSNSEFKLVERSFVPNIMDDLIDRYCSKGCSSLKSLWIVGNHSDELTPWIPVVARRLNAAGFFIIPCCPYDFFKKYQRHGSFPGSSIYQNYIEYICSIGDDYGYQPTLDKLRIPSTKNISLVGLDCCRKFDPKVLYDRVENILQKLNDGDKDSSISKFVPRAVESANENPKVDRKVAKEIVNKIFSLLLKDWHSASKDKWYTGKETLTFNEIMNELSNEEKLMLKGKGNGLRTLIKSNKHLFTLNGNFVKLRMPSREDMQNVSETSRDRIKTLVCYFYVNHPQGCPLTSELCTYKHETD